MASEKRQREAAMIKRVCAEWRELVCDLAKRIHPLSGLALGEYLIRRIEGLSDQNPFQRVPQPAPATGFYFCARCLSHQDPNRDPAAEAGGPDTGADYRPILQVRGMSAPRCKRCASKAVWIGPAAFPVLGKACECSRLPSARVREDDLPGAIAAVIDAGANPLTVPPPGVETVYPVVTVGYVVRTRCGICGQLISAKNSELGRCVSCPSCGAPITVAGEVLPRFQIKVQCPACKARATLRPHQVGRPVTCSGCCQALLPAHHRLDAAGDSPSDRPVPPPSDADGPTAPQKGDDAQVDAPATTDADAEQQIARLRRELQQAEARLLERDRVLTTQQAEIETLRSQLEAFNAGHGFRGLGILFDTLMQREDEIAALRELVAEKDVLLMSKQDAVAPHSRQVGGIGSLLGRGASSKSAAKRTA